MALLIFFWGGRKSGSLRNCLEVLHLFCVSTTENHAVSANLDAFSIGRLHTFKRPHSINGQNWATFGGSGSGTHSSRVPE